MQEINKMKQQIQDHLDKVILPFWESLKDDEYGGFYGYMDIDLNVDKKAVKGCILNNRILWFCKCVFEPKASRASFLCKACL